VKAPVVFHERRALGAQHFADVVFVDLSGNLWIDSRQDLAQSLDQHHVAVAHALGEKSVWGDIGPVENAVGEAPEEFEGRFFDRGFGYSDCRPRVLTGALSASSCGSYNQKLTGLSRFGVRDPL